MFKVGDKVVCLVSIKIAPEIVRGRTYTVKDVIYDERDDSHFLIGIDGVYGSYSSLYFQLYEVYHRKDKIERLRTRMVRKHQSFYV